MNDFTKNIAQALFDQDKNSEKNMSPGFKIEVQH